MVFYWCPKGCGKKVYRMIKVNQHDNTLYKCMECKKMFDKEMLLIINNKVGSTKVEKFVEENNKYNG